MAWKKLADRVINGLILRPLGLRLAFSRGRNPIDDLADLMRGRAVRVIVDGGAYIGTFSREAAEAFPEASIHAFEPMPASCARLSDNTAALSNIVCHQLALGSEAGTATFFANASPLTNSLLRSSEIGHDSFAGLVVEEKELTVEVTTLKQFARQEGLAAIDILKLDLQGNELSALIGMGDLIERTQLIFIEVQFVPLYVGAPLFTDIEALLRRHGFELYQLYDLVRSPKNGRLLQGDAMFARSDLLSVGGIPSEQPPGSGPT